MIRTHNFVKVNEFGEELNYSNLYVNPVAKLKFPVYKNRDDTWDKATKDNLDLEHLTRLIIFYNYLSQIDKELYKEDYLLINTNRWRYVDKCQKGKRLSIGSYTELIGQLMSDDDWDDNTRDEDVQHTQHLIMYTTGLCDIEDQTACCCDLEPIELDKPFQPNNNPIDPLLDVLSDADVEYDTDIRLIDNYRADNISAKIKEVTKERLLDIRIAHWQRYGWGTTPPDIDELTLISPQEIAEITELVDKLIKE